MAIQDICIENSAGHNTKFAGVELTSTDQVKLLAEGNNSHPLLEVNYTAIGPDLDILDDNTFEQLGARKVKATFDASFEGHNDCKNIDFVMLDKVLSRLVLLPIPSKNKFTAKLIPTTSFAQSNTSCGTTDWQWLSRSQATMRLPLRSLV